MTVEQKLLSKYEAAVASFMDSSGCTECHGSYVEDNELGLHFVHADGCRVAALRDAVESLKWHMCWPDGSPHREQWMSKVWYYVPMEILAQACIRAKEDTGPHYLMFMEPPGYQPKADFTCWICGKPTPHTHSHAEVEAARTTLAVFHDNVWKHMTEWAASRAEPVKEKSNVD